MDSYKCSAEALLQFYDEDKKILDVIHEIEKELGAENKYVCQFAIDNKPLTTEHETALAGMMLSEISSIEYIVADLLTLVIEVAEGWIGAIDEQIEPLYALAIEMVEKPSHGSYKRLDQVFNWCSEFVESLVSMKVHRAPAKPEANRALEWDILESRLSVTVSDLLAKSEKKDFKGVAYGLEYDLVENLQGWRKELEKFIAEVRRTQQHQRGQGVNARKKAISHFVGRSAARSRAIN